MLLAKHFFDHLDFVMKRRRRSECAADEDDECIFENNVRTKTVAERRINELG